MNMGEGGETVKRLYRELDLESPGSMWAVCHPGGALPSEAAGGPGLLEGELPQSASRAISHRPGLLWSDFCQVGLL